MSNQRERLAMSDRASGAPEMLRQAIRVLCSNTVPYDTKLSIDAIIGVTIDNAEIIFVNIHETISKSDDVEEGHQSSALANHAEAIVANVVSARDESSEITGNIRHKAQCEVDTRVVSRRATVTGASAPVKMDNRNVPTQEFIAKVEVDADIIEIDDDDDKDVKAAVGENGSREVSDTYPEVRSGGTRAGTSNVNFSGAGGQFSYGDEYFDGSASYNECDWSSEIMNDNNVYPSDNKEDILMSSSVVDSGRGSGLLYRCTPCKKSFVYHGAYIRHRRRHQTRPQLSTPGDAHPVVNERPKVRALPSSERCSLRPDELIVTKSIVADGEVGTVYTCSVCGQKIRHLSTFIRHKKQHEGAMYSCDICEFTTSRRDSLLVHRRRCLMKCQQLLGVR